MGGGFIGYGITNINLFGVKCKKITQALIKNRIAFWGEERSCSWSLKKTILVRSQHLNNQLLVGVVSCQWLMLKIRFCFPASKLLILLCTCPFKAHLKTCWF